MGDSSYGEIKSVKHALEILSALTAMGGGTLAALSEELDLSKSSIHNHLNTLHELGYVEKEDGEYDVGLLWLRFGGYARTQLPIYRRARDSIDQLARKTGELALISVASHGSSIPIYHARGEDAVTTDSYVGVELPLHCTATGKAMLAALPDERRRATVEDLALEREATNTITDPEELLADLEATRERGFSLDDEERIDGLRGIGAPITDQRDGEVLGGIAITGPVHRLDDDRFTETYPALVANVAREIEINIAYERR